jgi:cytochrome c oxidase subunit I
MSTSNSTSMAQTGAPTSSPSTAISQKVRRMALLWMVTALLVFTLMVLAGIAMRATQGGDAVLSDELFYAAMTLHGLGMSGTLFVSGLVIGWVLLAPHVKAFLGLQWVVFGLVLVGTAGLVVATVIGHFAAGWYLLYPLPFVNPTWPSWSTILAVGSLIALGVAWLIAECGLLFAIIERYGLSNALGWQYLAGSEPAVKIPPAVLICTISLIAGIVATMAGAALLFLYAGEWFNPEITYNPLLMKNLVFLFGHTIVNITMYFGIAAVYEYVPEFSRRPWVTNRLVVISWNLTLIFVLTAYFHHLYMDYVQPGALQELGQIVSYISVLPATAVTLFGLISQVYRSGLVWKFVPLALFLALVGWTIGGFAAVVDSTITVNLIFHNTLWVPAHFHTYFLMGYVIILFAFIYKLIDATSERTAKTALLVMSIGGYGFLLMFYLGGMWSVPRRYAGYANISMEGLAALGQRLAAWGAIFAAVFLLGLVVYFGALMLGGRRAGARAARRPV